MNRVLILVGVLLMLMAGTVQAYEGFRVGVRQMSMAGDDSFNSNFFTDTNDSYHWFGRIYGNADHAHVTWDGGNAASMGLIKSEESYGAYMLHLQQGWDGFGDMESNHFTLGYGLPLSGMDVGVVYNRQSSREKVDADTEMTESYNIFGVGVTYEMDEETTIDGTFAFLTGSYDNGDDDSDNDPDYSGFDIAVRAFRGLRDDVTAVPVFEFMTQKEDIGGDEYKETMIALGLAFDYVINDDNTLLVGGSWQQYKEEYPSGDDTVEMTTTTLPGIYAGVEHEFTDMFTARMAATKNFQKFDDGDEYEANEYPFGYTLGLGIAMGDWVIDLELYEGWLYDFGYWVHGTAGGQPIAQIEAKLFF